MILNDVAHLFGKATNMDVQNTVKESIENLLVQNATQAAASATSIETLTAALTGLNVQQKINILTQKGYNLEQIKHMPTVMALTKEELALEVANYKLATSEGVATGATGLLTTATTALTTAIKANPLLFAAGAIVASVYAVYKVIDTFSKSLENAKKKADESIKSYKEAKSALEGVNSEIKGVKDRIDELNKIDHLSFVEQEELSNLKDSNEELDRQLRIKQAIAKLEQEKSRKDAVEYFNTDTTYTGYVGLDDIPANAIAGYSSLLYEDQNGTIIDQAKNQLQEYELLVQRKEDLDVKMSDFQLNHPSDYQKNDEYIDMDRLMVSLDNRLNSISEDLQDTMSNIDTFDDVLDPKKDFALIEQLENIFLLFEQIFNPDSKASTKSFDEVWNSNSFKTYKQELEKMAVNGTLDPSVFESNEEYNRLLVKTGKTADEVTEHIYSLVAAIDDTPNSIKMTKSAMIDAFGEMSNGFDVLKDIYNDVRDGKDFDFAKLNSSKFSEAFKGLEDEYTEFIETISDSPNKMTEKNQQAFNKLATAFINQSDIMKNVTDETKDLAIGYLNMFNVTNAQTLVEEKLAAQHVMTANNLHNLKLEHEGVSDKANEVIAGLFAEGQSADVAALALYDLYTTENIFASKTLNSEQKIEELKKLAESYGVVNATISATMDANAELMRQSGVSEEKILDYYNRQIKQWIEGKFGEINTVEIKPTNPKQSGSSKDTWLEEYKDKLKILQDQLAMQEITEKEYYDGAEQLMNYYLKSSEERIQKYAKEIKDAEKDLHDSYTKVYSEAKQEIQDNFDKGIITSTEYLKQLALLADKFYGILGIGNTAKPLSDLSQELQDWVLKFEDLNQQCTDYVAGLDDVYKKYGNINNLDRDIIYWDDDTLNKWAKQIEDWDWNWDGKLKDSWSTVLGDVDNFNGLEIAFSAILNTDQGAIPLTKAEFGDYINQLVNTAAQNGGYNAENVLKFDAQGFDMMVNGSMQHVSNMIAAVEGQIINGAKLTANDVLAISGVTSKEIGYNLNSAFEGKSMHSIQEQALAAQYEYQQLAKEAKAAGINIEEYIGNRGSEAMIQYGKFTKEQAEEIKAFAETYKDMMDKGINAVMSLIDRQISKLEKAEKAQTKPLENSKKELEKQIKSYDKLIKGIDKQISAIDKEIDKLDEANEKRKQELDLMKKKYELERAENQKSQQVYKDGNMIFTTDDAAIREARENLRDTEFEIQKDGLEEQKKVLERQKELYEEQKELLEDKIADIDEQLSGIEESYAKMTENLNNQKDKWQEILDLFTDAENMALLEGLNMFGTSDLTTLNNNVDEIKQKYVEALSLMNDQNANFLDSLAKISNLSFGNLPTSLGALVDLVGTLGQSFAGADTESLQSSINEASEKGVESVTTLKDAIGGEDGSLATSVKSVNSVISGSEESSGGEGKAGETSDNLQGAIANATATALDEEMGVPAQVGAWDTLLVKLGEILEQINNIISQTATAMQKIKELGSANAGVGESSHAKGTVGSAFANGTGYDGLKSAEKNALRSEYGQPELTVYPNGTYEVTNTPTLSDLPKDTVIFNERQTKKILNSGGIKGKAFADGTQNQTVMFAGKERSLSDIATLSAKLTEGFNLIGNTIKNVGDNIASQVTNLNNVVNNRREVKQEIKQEFNITMPNITDKTSAESLMRDLQSLSSKKIQYFLNA